MPLFGVDVSVVTEEPRQWLWTMLAIYLLFFLLFATLQPILSDRNLYSLLGEAFAQPSGLDDTREFLRAENLKRLRKGCGQNRCFVHVQRGTVWAVRILWIAIRNRADIDKAHF